MKFLRNLICLSFIVLAFCGFDAKALGFADSQSKSTIPASILRSHGPDAFGYYYYDSDDSAANAPAYQWIEISSSGIEIDSMSDDHSRGPYPIGFNFSYYGSLNSNFRVCSNGFLSFTSASTEYFNSGLPSTLDPNNTLAVFWDDLTPDSLSHLYYFSNNLDTLIVAWHNYHRSVREGRYTFEVILTANGNITYQYQSLNGTLDSHTIGIENVNGTIGLEYIYNFQSNETGRAILFSRTPPDYGQHNILIVAADSASHYINAMRAFSDMGNIDFFDAHIATPTLSQLQTYDAVVVWSNMQFFDATALGNVLADYLDADGAVVLHQFCFGIGWALSGRLMSQYSPFTTGEISTHRRYLGSYDPGHPLMAGVDSLSDVLTASVQLRNSPILVASYIDGTPLIAYNPIKKLVAINGYAGDTQQFTGDMFRLSHNAINFAIDGAPQILIVASDDAQMARRELSTFPDIHSVHIYDARLSTPTIQLLSTYKAVVVWGNEAFSDPIALGNNLADFLDGGTRRGVVLMQFCFGHTGSLQGRIMNSYSPFTTGNIPYITRTLGWYNDGNPLMNNVNNVTDYFASNVSLQNDRRGCRYMGRQYSLRGF